MVRQTPPPAVALPVVVLLAAAAAAVSALPAINVTTMAFEDGYAPLFGHGNILRSADHRTGLVSPRRPCTSTASSARPSSSPPTTPPASSSPSTYASCLHACSPQASNGDVFEKRHDELDFEFLGNIRGKPWRVQTNVYGNGSVGRGREERYVLPFDPTTEFHRYSILWTPSAVAFYIDDVPVREVRRSDAMGGDFPSKPMSIYATVWDASTWATAGGRYRVNYRYGPFVASFTDLALLGCRVDGPIQQVPAAGRCAAAEEKLRASDVAVMTVEKQQAMRRFRERNMVYSYCYDTLRYPSAFPECDVVESERRRFKDTGHLRFALRRRMGPRRSGGRASSRAAAARDRDRNLKKRAADM